ncbi:MAG: nucleoside hydrolase [Sulfobacillus acidophilus]|uniref:Nucleoside hydrolase n=1 Tax=Sulfobacillus acidophilus TaxID=53633 RepID=A0A2T2WPA3_9FIRM|nr:MAG: nucleoside hydrolase [Sulfobacillus acidophilus]
MNPLPVILDVDTGIDDAWALVYALRSPALNVIGITTGFGNADVASTTRNTLLLTQLLDTPVPVYRGADRPLWRTWSGPVIRYHGHNGLGDAILPPVHHTAQRQEAVPFIVDAVHQAPGQVTIITLARLTNLARALLFDSTMVELIKGVVMMGGSAFVPGNVTPVAEANVWGDPEAADIVFKSGLDITMVGLDVTMQARLYREHLARLNPTLSYAQLLQQATTFYISAYEQDNPDIVGWCPIHDPLAVAVVEDPDLVTVERLPVQVETRGQHTDGMTVVDGRTRHYSNGIQVALSLNRDRFLQRLGERVGIS